MPNSVNFPGTAYTNLADFTVLATEKIENTGNTTITGNIGLGFIPLVSGGAGGVSGTVSGFPPGTCTGRTDIQTTKSNQAAMELEQLFNTIYSFSGTPLQSGSLSGAYGPGTYKTPDNMYIDGTLTLTGSATDQFFFFAANPIFFGNKIGTSE